MAEAGLDVADACHLREVHCFLNPPPRVEMPHHCAEASDVFTGFAQGRACVLVLVDLGSWPMNPVTAAANAGRERSRSLR
jgi:hypothetical protein